MSFQAAIAAFADAPSRLIASGTGIDSQTLQRNPAASMRRLRASIAASAQATPAGTSCKAVTTPVAPACAT